jgi:hypothetical protein
MKVGVDVVFLFLLVFLNCLPKSTHDYRLD